MVSDRTENAFGELLARTSAEGSELVCLEDHANQLGKTSAERHRPRILRHALWLLRIVMRKSQFSTRFNGVLK